MKWIKEEGNYYTNLYNLEEVYLIEFTESTDQYNPEITLHYIGRDSVELIIDHDLSSNDNEVQGMIYKLIQNDED